MALLSVDDLSVRFTKRSGGVFSRTIGTVSAVDGVSFSIEKGETLGLVGESGSGKTTLGLSVLRGVKPTSGRVVLQPAGEALEITGLGKRDLRRARQHMQMIFQDPYSSLNPRMTVREILTEPLTAGLSPARHLPRAEIDARVVDIAVKCGLSVDQLRRFPMRSAAGSGSASASPGPWRQPQAGGVRRAVSALDVSIQAQVLNLLADLQGQFG
jgi:peptide/nickel transport system ATP-binding protein